MLPCPAASVCPLQGPVYNRHTLPGDSEPMEQAKEILILRHKSLLVEVSGSGTCSTRKESQKEDSCSVQSEATPQLKPCHSFTVGNTEKVWEGKESRSKSVCAIPPPQPSSASWGGRKELSLEI
ncbi:hypothetical protein HGM15179_020032 [Zosterops borbonicus]|uniref:Uncharacterized protein n=1 Tax=Zosterops borbonicus TaxID=364589 RepID=A0A8K1FVD1_9PASS|nr:hypothetical protein HGM15179_020032 [Zosterops borbonicus]